MGIQEQWASGWEPLTEAEERAMRDNRRRKRLQDLGREVRTLVALIFINPLVWICALIWADLLLR